MAPAVTRRAENLKGEIDRQIGDLFPGYFALVMATGMVSLASHALGIAWAARPLFLLNIAAYAVLWALLVARIVRHPGRIAADARDHLRGPGFFTLIAATCVVGNQALILARRLDVAALLWGAALLLWMSVMYTFFAAVTVREQKPSIDKGLSGGWLLAVVATQAVALLGAQVAGSLGSWREPALFISLALHLAGCMLYILMISLIFYRWTFFGLSPQALTPSYWINMGAVAITTRAAILLADAAPGWAFLAEILPFLKGFALFFWSTATWWIPLLVILTGWKHLKMRHPLAYDPQYWGLVFPLAMYTICTLQLSALTRTPFLLAIPRITVWVALAAWAVGFVGLSHNLAQGFLRFRNRAAEGPRERDEAAVPTDPAVVRSSS